MLYYSGSYSRVFALDGATGEVLWSYIPKLDEDLVARQTHSPYNRGMAMGDGRLYVGTVDGRLIALDMKTGKPAWDTKLINSQKLTVGFTGAPLLVKDKVIIGAQGGEWPYRGPIFGVDAKTGEKEWEFLTVGGTDEAMKTWGNESWRTGGGGGWMPGTYDAETNTVWWGTANPGAALRLGRRQLEDRRAAPGRQPLHHLGDRRSIPTPASSSSITRNCRTTPGTSTARSASSCSSTATARSTSCIRTRAASSSSTTAPTPKVENVWPLVKNINFVKNIDPKTGELVGRRDMAEGPQTRLCARRSPAASAGTRGTYSPQTGLYYKIGNEWCMDLTVVKTTPVTEPQAQLNIGATFTITDPPGGKSARPCRRARPDHRQEKPGRCDFPEPPLASLLSTAGGLVFVPDARGWLHAYDAETGKELWKHNDGIGTMAASSATLPAASSTSPS